MARARARSASAPRSATRVGAQADRWAALLRGVNVVGKNMVRMDELRELFASLGLADVSTYIQSGNVIFGSTWAEATIASRCQAALQERFNLPVRVVVRSARELSRIAAASPFDGADPSRVMVTFCDRKPAGTLDASRSPGDSFAIVDRHVFLHCPRGVSESKFTLDYIERALGVSGTMRNLRTTAKLAELTAQAAVVPSPQTKQRLQGHA